MKTHATGSFEVKSWDEKPHNEGEAIPQLVRASVVTTFQGDIEGEGKLEYLLSYLGDEAYYIGLEQVIGRIGDRAGSFVLQHGGTFKDGGTRCTWFVVPGSGTGDLRGLRGEGGYETGKTQSIPFTLDYEIV